MKIGIIGLGVVGSALHNWFKLNTTHEIKCYDPYKNLTDDFTDISAAFISVPVPMAKDGGGQDLSILKEAILHASFFTDLIFIRSTVLPGTADRFKSYGCVSMPEFLTERRADQDMNDLPIVVGESPTRSLFNHLHSIFPGKQIVFCGSNKAAELAKFTHNCFGAFKVSYFNMIYKIAEAEGVDFELLKRAANITGFLGEEHMQVPGPDGKFGYGGKCFPENMMALSWHLLKADLAECRALVDEVINFNTAVRGVTEWQKSDLSQSLDQK